MSAFGNRLQEPRFSGQIANSFDRRQIETIDPLKDGQWDIRLPNKPELTVFHSAGWAKVLHSSYGHLPLYLRINYQDSFGGLVPLMEVDSPFTGRRGVSLPFTDDCPALSSEFLSLNGLFQTAIEFGKSRKWKYIEFRGGDLGEPAINPSTCFYTHILHLDRNPEVLFSGFESSIRRAIRKAEKADVQTEISSSQESLRSYYLLHCQTRKKHGLPPQSFAFFRNIHEHLLSKGNGFVVLARIGGIPIAGSVFLHMRNKAIYKYGASDMRFQNLRPNNMVMWEAIKWCSENGFTSLNFGRTSTGNEGLRRYKLGYGTEEQTLRYYRFDYRQNSFATHKDQAEGWFNYLFRLMPLPVLRLAGQVLYRHLC
jgi:hypothetical protein